MKRIVRWITLLLGIFLIAMAPLYLLPHTNFAGWPAGFKLAMTIGSAAIGYFLIQRFRYFRALALAKRQQPQQ